MSTDVLDGIPVRRLSVQDLLDHILAVCRDEARYQIIAVEDLLVKFIRVGVLKWQVPAGHCIEDNAAAPNVRDQPVVALACNHLWRCIARTSACSLKRFSVLVGVGQAKVNYLDMIFIVK